MPKISIILPAYNRANTILRAINSVIGQTCKDWELIIIDDGSTDGTGKLVRPLCKKDPRIFYRRQENMGAIAARQTGLSLARGKIISFLDSDDYYLPAHLQKHYDYLQKHPETDAVYGKTTILGNRFVADVRDNSRLIHLDKCHIYSTFFIRKKIFRKIKKLPDAPLGADYLLYWQMRRHSFKIKKTAWRTYVYDRTSPDSTTKQYQISLLKTLSKPA